MTYFEELCKELGVKIQTGERGLYTGMTEALAQITTEVIMSDDDTIFDMDFDDQKKLIKAKFYKVFPYMKEEKSC